MHEDELLTPSTAWTIWGLRKKVEQYMRKHSPQNNILWHGSWKPIENLEERRNEPIVKTAQGKKRETEFVYTIKLSFNKKKEFNEVKAHFDSVISRWKGQEMEIEIELRPRKSKDRSKHEGQDDA